MTDQPEAHLRVLFACVPQAGHATPLLPLAAAFAAHGDEVILASVPDLECTATSRGLSFRPVSPPFGDWFAILAARTRGIPGDGLAPERVTRYFVPRLFGEVGLPAMLDPLSELVRTVRPDLLVFDSFAFAAPLVAARFGIPAVQHAVGPLLDPRVLDLVTDAVTPAWREAGLAAPDRAGLYDGATVTICPPSLDPSGAALDGALALRPTAVPVAPAPLEFPLAYPGRPLVYLTLGTFSYSNLELFRLLLDALAELPVNVLATIGRDNDPATLGEVPHNARVERFVPQAEMLPHCSAVVHHAGAGTMFGVLAHGLPSVVLPQSADNFDLAHRLGATRLARVLGPDEVSPSAVADGVHTVLTDPVYRAASEHIAAEIAAMPDPTDVVTHLKEQLP